MRCQSPWSRHNRSILLSDILKAMPITLRDYQPQDREQLTELFDEFLRYLVVLDPLSRMRHTPGYEAVVLDKDLQEVREHRGKFAVAVDGTTILGFVIGIIQERKNQPDVIDFTAGRITELYVDEAVSGLCPRSSVDSSTRISQARLGNPPFSKLSSGCFLIASPSSSSTPKWRIPYRRRATAMRWVPPSSAPGCWQNSSSQRSSASHSASSSTVPVRSASCPTARKFDADIATTSPP